MFLLDIVVYKVKKKIQLMFSVLEKATITKTTHSMHLVCFMAQDKFSEMCDP